jgi:hypothetical protein
LLQPYFHLHFAAAAPALGWKCPRGSRGGQGCAGPEQHAGKGRDDKPPGRAKPVRDSLTMPRADFALVAQLEDRGPGFRRPAKKSGLLRTGLHAPAALDEAKPRAALESLAPVKAGRPTKLGRALAAGLPARDAKQPICPTAHFAEMVSCATFRRHDEAVRCRGGRLAAFLLWLPHTCRSARRARHITYWEVACRTS